MNIKDKSFLILLLLILLHGFIMTKLIFFPYPEFFVYPYLTNEGLKPYSQIFDQHFPGLMFLPFNLDNLGMNDEFSARWWLIGLIGMTHLLIYFISFRIFNNKWKALIANIFYLLWQPYLEGWMLWIDNFMPLFLLPAFYYSYLSISEKKNSNRNIFFTGFFLSLGILFKQMAIPLTALVFLLIWFYEKRFSVIWPFVLGLLPITLLTGAYLLSINVLKDFWYWTVTYNLTTFAAYGRKPAYATGLIKIIFIYSIIFFSYLSSNKKLIICLLVFIIGGLSGDIARFDLVHFQTSLPFLSILFAEVFFLIRKTKFKIYFYVFYILVIIFWMLTFYKGHLSDKVYFFDESTKNIINKVRDYTEEKERIFLFGVSPHIYQQSQTLPTGDIFVFQFPWFLMETEDKFLKALQNNPPNLIVADSNMEIEGVKLKDYAKSIDMFIESRYEAFDRSDNVIFLRLKKSE